MMTNKITEHSRNEYFLSSTGKFYAFRLQPEEELIAALRHFTLQTGLKAGFIAGAVGSLSMAAIRFAAQEQTTLIEKKLEVTSLIGTLDQNGEHLHITVADEVGHVYGGHIMAGCQVRTTMELIIGVLDEMVFSREHCPLSGYDELQVTHYPQRRETNEK